MCQEFYHTDFCLSGSFNFISRTYGTNEASASISLSGRQITEAGEYTLYIHMRCCPLFWQLYCDFRDFGLFWFWLDLFLCNLNFIWLKYLPKRLQYQHKCVVSCICFADLFVLWWRLSFLAWKCLVYWLKTKKKSSVMCVCVCVCTYIYNSEHVRACMCVHVQSYCSESDKKKNEWKTAQVNRVTNIPVFQYFYSDKTTMNHTI